eukprot:gene8456-10765_t
MVPGLTVMPLMQQGSGSTLVRWAPQTYFNPHKHYGGEEIFVVDGVFEDEHGRYPAGSWIRSPHMSLHQPFSKEGCTIFVKTGHLLDLPIPQDDGSTKHLKGMKLPNVSLNATNGQPNVPLLDGWDQIPEITIKNFMPWAQRL